MKKRILSCILLLLLLATCLVACVDKDGDGVDNSSKIKVTMTAKILQVSENSIFVDVVESQYAYGEYSILVGDQTTVLDADGKVIALGNLKVGDLIEVGYSGQVMLSYPPQVVAYQIKLCK